MRRSITILLILGGIVSLITGFVLGASPSKINVFLHVPFYSFALYMLGALFLGYAVYANSRKRKN